MIRYAQIPCHAHAAEVVDGDRVRVSKAAYMGWSVLMKWDPDDPFALWMLLRDKTGLSRRIVCDRETLRHFVDDGGLWGGDGWSLRVTDSSFQMYCRDEPDTVYCTAVGTVRGYLDGLPEQDADVEAELDRFLASL